MTTYHTYKSDIPDTMTLGFKKGKGYFGRPALPAASGSDPFAALSPRDITSAVNQFGGSTLNDNQIQSTARGMIDPLIAAITKSATDRAGASSAAIKGITDSYAGELGKIDWGAPYQSAIGQQAAVDDALNQTLTGAGSDLASQLKARLASYGGDPAVSEAASGLASRGAAAGATEVARGSNALSSLIASAAAAGSYGQKLPGVARLSGIQGVRDAQSQATSDIASGTQGALGQLPSILSGLRAENSNTLNRRGDVYTTLTGQNLTKATAKAGLDLDTQKTNAALTPTPDATWSGKTGVVSDQYGNPVPDTNGNVQTLPGYHVNPKTGKVVKDAKPTATKPRTPAATKQLNDLAHKLYNGVSPHFHPVDQKDPKTGEVTVQWVPVPGTGAAPIKWNDAVRQLMAAGARTREEAVQILASQGWMPGEGGRPRSAQQKNAAAAKNSALAGRRERDARSGGKITLDKPGGGNF